MNPTPQTIQRYPILASIDSPADLKGLSVDQLRQLCEELRCYIIDILASNPGHFASSLGVVELTVALHYVFNTPTDRLIWDVGHQAYSHKILTGRRDQFITNRQIDGLSGFPSRTESNYDAFGTGHASTSISAALGMAVAHSLNNDPAQTIAIIGDGSMTGGLAYEGLNNASINPNNLLIILNDNNMAIDQPVGGLSTHLVSLTTSRLYNKMRVGLYHLLCRTTNPHKGSFTRLSNSIKSFIGRQNNLFDGLNIRYFGPIDGHDLPGLIRVLEDMRHIPGPKLLHIKTQKGKGYSPAESDAAAWHAPGQFNAATGERIQSATTNLPPLFQEVFGQTLVELAEQNQSIVGITPAMPSGCSMTYLFDRFPERAFDVGIAESHAVTFAAGMAVEGALPYVNIYSSFMQRAFDQVIHDVALQRLRIVMCLDRSGLVGEDGPTHHGVFDLAYFRAIPNLTIAAPIDEIDLRHLMYTASHQDCGPLVIRYPRGRGSHTDWQQPMHLLPIGKGTCISQGSQIALLSLGEIGIRTRQAVEELKSQGISCAHYDLRFLKPLDTELLDNVFAQFSHIVTLEEGSIIGGVGSAILEYMSDQGYTAKILRIGIPDRFVEHGNIDTLRKRYRLDTPGIVEQIKSFL